MGTRRQLFVACSLFIVSCLAQNPAPNAIEVDGDVKKFFKIGAARDGIQKAILDEVLPAGDHNNFVDDEIEDPGAYDEEITDSNHENPIFIPRLYRNETAEEKAATATTKRITTTTTPRPRSGVTRTSFENFGNPAPNFVPHVQPQQPQLPPQPLPQPRVQQPQPQPQVFPPQQPQPQPRLPVQPQQPFVPQQPNQFRPVAPPPQTLPPQQHIPQQPLPQQPQVQRPQVQQPQVQQPQVQQPQPQFIPQVPRRPDQFNNQFTAPPQSLPNLRPQQPPPVQQPQVPQRPQPRPRPRPPQTTSNRNPQPFQPRPQSPRPQDPTGLRTGVCRQSIFYITAPVHPVDTHLTFTHFAAVVSVDQCARTCHEFNCAIAHYDPSTGHCQFNPSTSFSIREGQCPRWPANHYKNNYVSNQAIRIFCITCQRGRRSRNRNTGRSFLSHRDMHGFIRRPKNKPFQPSVIGRAASTQFSVQGVILRQPQSTAIGVGPFTQRENSFLVKKSNEDPEQQLVQISEGSSTSASTTGEGEEVSATESTPSTQPEESESASTEKSASTENTSEAETSSSTSAPTTEEQSETEQETETTEAAETTTTRRPRRQLHRASGIATHIRRIGPDHH